MKKRIFGILLSILLVGSIAFTVYAANMECPRCGKECSTACSGSYASTNEVSVGCTEHDDCSISTEQYYTYARCSDCDLGGNRGKHPEYEYHSGPGTYVNVCTFSSSVASLRD